MADLILVVDDEPSITDNIAYALTTEGFQPVCVATGADAQDKLSTLDIKLIILDVGLPDINGFELARLVRRHSAVPIIFVTARSDEIDRVVGLELGADDYVIKPFSPRELSARVKAVLRRFSAPDRVDQTGQQVDAATLVYGPFILDKTRCRIQYHASILELSRVEYRLLCALIEQPGRVFSRGQLLDRAWEHGGISLERTVDTHIKTIRRKLNDIADHAAIITHRGIGYSLRDDF
ncbi:MAG: two-component system response regulator CreB [Gammaproteobacteria bacterium]|nr:two-component system response regulator CreB [Gammaproteobacteria bacterium]